MPTVVAEQAPILPSAYHRAQARLGSALHIDAFTLVRTLCLLAPRASSLTPGRLYELGNSLSGFKNLCLFCFLLSVSAGLLSECANDPIKTELPCSGLATTRKKLLHPSYSLWSCHGLIKERAFLAQSLLKGPSSGIDGLLGQPQGIG
jgi:hypothetical protein